MSSAETSTQLLSIFNRFRDELDEHHDRRERIIKASRDITALSKKIIFSLHRARTLGASLPASIDKETQSRFDQILTLFQSVVPDLQDAPNPWLYQRQLSPGIQEYIEAVSFHHYIRTQTLVLIAEVRARLPPQILVTSEDYLMGLFDLTGEIMRLAVTVLSVGAAKGNRPSMASKEPTKSGEGTVSSVESQTTKTTAAEKVPTPSKASKVRAADADILQSSSKLPTLEPSQAAIVDDLRVLRSLFETLNASRRHHRAILGEMEHKLEVMQNSVEKVERAAYGVLVRGSERPAEWIPNFSGPPLAVAEADSY